MHRIKEKNTAMITISGVILVAGNMTIWLAAREGAIAPVGNSVVWGAFMTLNVVSILWAVVLLGLQPMVVALSYVAGGFLAFKGVEGLPGISAAEVTAAGATYGAFGALAVGNLTTKVRLAFYNKKQVPFIFIIVGLLVLDAVLNSGISSSGGRVILNAMIFPFLLAGVVFGLIWAVLNHFGVGYNPREAVAHAQAESEEVTEKAIQDDVSKSGVEKKDTALKIQVPEQLDEEEEIPEAISETTVEPEVPQSPSVKQSEAPAAELETNPDEFFPLEIDNDDEFALPEEEPEYLSELNDEDTNFDKPFSMPNFDSGLYESGTLDDVHGGVMIEEPLSAVSLDIGEDPVPSEDRVAPALEEREPAPPPAVQEAEPEPPTAVQEVESEPEKPSDAMHNAKPEDKKQSGDWLNGHLDLLNKLK